MSNDSIELCDKHWVQGCFYCGPKLAEFVSTCTGCHRASWTHDYIKHGCAFCHTGIFARPAAAARISFCPLHSMPIIDGICSVCDNGQRDHNASLMAKDEPAHKFDAGKPRMDLIPPEMLDAAGRVLGSGAVKYAERNWEKGMSWGRCFGALMRHLWVWWGGEELDPETGFCHLDHALCCLAFLIAYRARGHGKDDRFIKSSEG